MGLYYNLLRIRSWARREGRTPNITEALDFLDHQKHPAGMAPLYWRMRNVFETMRHYECKKTLETLEGSWSLALASGDIPFDEPVEAVSLIDFPRYLGASWPHNDIAVYLPGFTRASVMKLSDSRFEPLRNRLMALTSGTDPFIGTAFEISHSKLNPVFNRIRSSKAKPVDPRSFKNLESFKRQLDSLSGSYIDASHLASHFRGNLQLGLDRCITARYGSNYALMRFVVADADVATAVRHREWDYTFKFRVDSNELSGWMFRNSLFDPNAQPEKYGGLKCRFAAFAVVGKSALEEYRFHLHVIAISPLDGLETPKPSAIENQTGHSVSAIEEELLRLEEEIRGTRETKEEELDVEAELILQEEPQAPRIQLVNESDFPPLEGRTLIILGSSRTRGFGVGEIVTRLGQEGIREANYSSVEDALRKLGARELAFQNVFGDAWYINPATKVRPSQVVISQVAVEERLLQFLRAVYPNKIKLTSLVGKFCQEDSRINPKVVRKAVDALISAKKLFQDGTGKCYANLYPPRMKPKTESEPPRRAANQLKEHSVELTEHQVLRIPFVAYAHGKAVVVYKGHEVAKRPWILSPEDSLAKIRQLLSDIKAGRYSALEFEDQLNGKFRVSFDGETLRATYVNTNERVLRFVLEKLRRENT